MNFFERQQAARGTSLRLVVLFVLGVLSIVAVIDVAAFLAARPADAASAAGLLTIVTAITLLIIAGGTFSKMLALRAGGSAVARSVGATPVDPTTADPRLRRFVNVVEEMSLASGVPMPQLFVMEREPGINAFAAGYTPADAAICVTGGALAQLNRDELQGVIGHEFSHVLNGDMRLNIRLIGLLNGILLLGLIGLRVLAFGGGGGDRDRKGGGAAPILVVALAMLVLGFVGQFFAGLIKAAVSRQRELLADASAVQFTRQTSGLVGALKKIAGLPAGSALTNARNASEVSHMLFGEGGKRFSSLFATHPPLLERIKLLDPSFRPEEIESVATAPAAEVTGASGFAPGTAAPPTPAPSAVPPVARRPITPAEVTARVGTLSAEDIDRGAELSAQIDPQVRQVAGSPAATVPLLLSLALDPERRDRAAQYDLMGRAMPPADVRHVAACAELVDRTVPPHLRLPVVSLALPQLAGRPWRELDQLLLTLDALARADDTITLSEYCLTRIVGGYVADLRDPVGRSRPGSGQARGAALPAFTLLAAVAVAGNADPAEAEGAFGAAAQHLVPGTPVPFRPPADLVGELDRGWPVLDALDPANKQRLIEAMVVAVRYDGALGVGEAELLRTACSLLHCPLPRFVA